jgi:hypothetical protein
MKAIRPLLIAQVMKTASIIRDSSSTSMLSFTNTFDEHCAVQSADRIQIKPSTLTNSDLTNSASTQTSIDDISHSPVQAATTLTNLQFVFLNKIDGMDKDLLVPQPLIAPNFPDSQPIGEQIMKKFIQLLIPMDIWDGSDIFEGQKESLDQLHKSIFSLETNNISLEPESDCFSDTTFSLANLAMLDYADERHDCSAIHKEQHISPFDTESTPFQQSTGTHASTKVLPFKKRSFPTTSSKAATYVTNESTKLAGLSLNELQLARIGKYLESVNKKLKLGTIGSAPDNVSTSCLSCSQDSDPFCTRSPCSLNEDRASTQRNIGTVPQCDDTQHLPPGRHTQNECSTEINKESMVRAECKGTSTKCFENQSGSYNQETTRINIFQRQRHRGPDASTVPCVTNVDVWDDETLSRMDESVAMAISFPNTPTENMIPINPVIFFHVFVSTPIQRDVHQYIVNTVPPPYPARRYNYLFPFFLK